MVQYIYSPAHQNFYLYFVGTVNGPATPEPSINTAYTLLQNAVYNGNIQIPVLISGLDMVNIHFAIYIYFEYNSRNLFA